MFTIPSFPPNSRLVYSFSTTEDGNMTYEVGDRKVTMQNRRKFLSTLSIDPKIVVPLSAKHSNNVLYIEELPKDIYVLKGHSPYECDAILTTKKNIAIFLGSFGDCSPIILTNKKNSFLCVIHSGMASTALNIVKSAIDKITQITNCKAGDIIAGIGPAIRKESYTFPLSYKPNNYKGWNKHMYKISSITKIRRLLEILDKLHSSSKIDFVLSKNETFVEIDNIGRIKQQLLSSGVLTKNIFDSDINTYTNNRFYSHRRDIDNGQKDTGRFALVAMLK